MLCSLEERRLREDILVLYNYLKGGCIEDSAHFFTQVTNDRMRGSGLKLHHGRFRLDIKRVAKHCKRLPRKVVESPSLEIFKGCVCVVFREMAGNSSGRFAAGLNCLQGVF